MQTCITSEYKKKEVKYGHFHAPSVRKLASVSLLGTSRAPIRGSPSFQPVGFIKAGHKSTTGILSDAPTSHAATAYDLVKLAVLLGNGVSFAASKASS